MTRTQEKNIRLCPACQLSFEAASAQQVYCRGAECLRNRRHAEYRQRQDKQGKILHAKICANPACGKPFTTGYSKQRFCCSACQVVTNGPKFSMPTWACKQCKKVVKSKEPRDFCCSGCALAFYAEEDKKKRAITIPQSTATCVCGHRGQHVNVCPTCGHVRCSRCGYRHTACSAEIGVRL